MASASPPAPSELLDAVFEALSHPARRQILIVLYARGGTMTAGEIADRFKHAWPTTTRHLKVLQAAGLVASARRGRRRDYHLKASPALRGAEWILTWAGEQSDARTSERKAWADLPYASMLNAKSPPAAATAIREQGPPSPAANRVRRAGPKRA